MRIVIKVCEKCGEKYGYKVSGSTSPSDWNKAKGVTWKYCAECSPKTFIRPELHCPPLQRVKRRLWTAIHNWFMRHSRWYKKRWRRGREPQPMYDMGPVTVKPYHKVDLSSIYRMQFDMRRTNGSDESK